MSSTAARVRIREGVVGDAGRLAEIWRDAWQDAYADILQPAVLERITRSRRMATWLSRIMDHALGDSSESALFVAELDHRVVGLCESGRTRLRRRPTRPRTEVAEVFTLYVDPDAQREGVGRALLDRAIAWAREVDLDRIVLWVLRENEMARRFYRANGFVESGLQRVERMTGRPVSVRYARDL